MTQNNQDNQNNSSVQPQIVEAPYKPWTGAPPKLQPTEIETQLSHYVSICKNNETIPNIPEFQGFLGITQRTWDRYKKHKNTRYRRAIARAEIVLEAKFVSNLLHKSPVVQKLYAINKLGYVDKRIVEHDVTTIEDKLRAIREQKQRENGGKILQSGGDHGD